MLHSISQGGIRHWPAMEKWSDQYLDRKIGHEDCHVTYAKNKDDVFYFYGEKSVLEVSTVTEFLQVLYFTSYAAARAHAMY